MNTRGQDFLAPQKLIYLILTMLLIIAVLYIVINIGKWFAK